MYSVEVAERINMTILNSSKNRDLVLNNNKSPMLNKINTMKMTLKITNKEVPTIIDNHRKASIIKDNRDKILISHTENRMLINLHSQRNQGIREDSYQMIEIMIMILRLKNS